MNKNIFFTTSGNFKNFQYENRSVETIIFLKKLQTDGSNIVLDFKGASQVWIFSYLDNIYIDDIPFVGNPQEIVNKLQTDFFDEAPQSGGILPVNSVMVAEGDSIVSMAIVESGNPVYQRGWQNIGFLSFAQLLSGSKLYLPPTGMQAVGGATVSQIFARIASTTSLYPKIAFVCAGTNDLAGQTASYISSYLGKIRDAYLAVGSKVVFITILPRFGGQALSPANEIKRQQINTIIKSWSNNNVIVINGDNIINNASFYYDGLHPNTLGSYTLGAAVAKAINALVSNEDVSGVLSPDNTANTNLFFSGTGGGLSGGASGVVPSNWNLNANSIGATTSGSITSLSANSTYNISITGNYSGNSKSVDFFATPAYSIVSGDIIDTFGQYEIINNDPNVLCVSVQSAIWNSGFGDISQLYSMTPYNQENNPLVPGTKYIARAPSFTIRQGVTPANYGTYIKIFLKNQASPTPINFNLKIYRAGWIKIPARSLYY